MFERDVRDLNSGADKKKTAAIKTTKQHKQKKVEQHDGMTISVWNENNSDNHNDIEAIFVYSQILYIHLYTQY